MVDSLNEDNAADFTINDTGDQDWHIQLKQTGVRLEKGQWYRLSLKMKSSTNRKVSYALQRDGSTHKDAAGNEDWTPYCQEKVALTSEYQTITKEFQMKEGNFNPAVSMLWLKYFSLLFAHLPLWSRLRLGCP